MTRYQTICLDDGTAARLDGLCATSGRSPSEVVRHAIRDMPIYFDNYDETEDDEAAPNGSGPFDLHPLPPCPNCGRDECWSMPLGGTGCPGSAEATS